MRDICLSDQDQVEEGSVPGFDLGVPVSALLFGTVQAARVAIERLGMHMEGSRQLGYNQLLLRGKIGWPAGPSVPGNHFSRRKLSKPRVAACISPTRPSWQHTPSEPPLRSVPTVSSGQWALPRLEKSFRQREGRVGQRGSQDGSSYHRPPPPPVAAPVPVFTPQNSQVTNSLILHNHVKALGYELNWQEGLLPGPSPQWKALVLIDKVAFCEGVAQSKQSARQDAAGKTLELSGGTNDKSPDNAMTTNVDPWTTSGYRTNISQQAEQKDFQPSFLEKNACGIKGGLGLPLRSGVGFRDESRRSDIHHHEEREVSTETVLEICITSLGLMQNFPDRCFQT
ncbi:hypothetical protein BKA62DRAFT_673493 [Auriculariales sp. MPI-PUGE-AT-0066]|nr:hypothetical protein BKA62DRAFT_673493 [Auriculariales sp. MPI-PUGE-AT-0066]